MWLAALLMNKLWLDLLSPGDVIMWLDWIFDCPAAVVAHGSLPVVVVAAHPEGNTHLDALTQPMFTAALGSPTSFPNGVRDGGGLA